MTASLQARREADEAERAVTDPRSGDPYEAAMARYQEALRLEELAAQALRRLKERLPELQAIAATGKPQRPQDGVLEMPHGKLPYEGLKLV